MSEGHNSTPPQICSISPGEWTFPVISTYISTIAVLGIVFNLFVLIIFLLHKKTCTVAEIYLSNLAAADLLLVSFLPFWAISASRRFAWDFGQALCKVVNVSILMNAYCSIYFLVLVSIDRYLALVHPLSHEKFRNPFFVKLACLLTWLLGFLLSLPAFIHRNVIVVSNVTHCSLLYPNVALHAASEFVILPFGCLIPIAIILPCTLKILQTLRNRMPRGSDCQRTDQKATVLVLAVLACFLVCWLPYHVNKIFSVLRDIKVLTDCNHRKMLYVTGHIFTYLAFFNSVLNPILYVIVGKNFRQKVRDVFSQQSVYHTTSHRSSTTTTTFMSVRSIETIR